jgi:multisubunit Na+/H+ antiporter MnhC subunit
MIGLRIKLALSVASFVVFGGMFIGGLRTLLFSPNVAENLTYPFAIALTLVVCGIATAAFMMIKRYKRKLSIKEMRQRQHNENH